MDRKIETVSLVEDSTGHFSLTTKRKTIPTEVVEQMLNKTIDEIMLRKVDFDRNQAMMLKHWRLVAVVEALLTIVLSLVIIFG